jgi:DNA-directed RNA polymerase specialized sigma24 family protein
VRHFAGDGSAERHSGLAVAVVAVGSVALGGRSADSTPLAPPLQKLPPMQRNAVVLRHWRSLSTRETAIELGISEGTVKSHTARGLERLSALLNAEIR